MPVVTVTIGFQVPLSTGLVRHSVIVDDWMFAVTSGTRTLVTGLPGDHTVDVSGSGEVRSCDSTVSSVACFMSVFFRQKPVMEPAPLPASGMTAYHVPQ